MWIEKHFDDDELETKREPGGAPDLNFEPLGFCVDHDFGTTVMVIELGYCAE